MVVLVLNTLRCGNMLLIKNSRERLHSLNSFNTTAMKRFASTNKNTHENTDTNNVHKHVLPQWKISDSPSPYEVLDIKNIYSHTNKKFLKKRFHDLCKVYHPDLSKTKVITGTGNEIVSEKEKLERFKIIKEAYLLLSNSSSKSAYDQFQVGWAYKKHTDFEQHNNNQQGRHQQSPFHHQYQHQDMHNMYWNASNWEEYQNYYKRSGNSNHMAIKGQKLSPYEIIIYILVLGALGEGVSLLSDIQTSFDRRVDMHEQCERDLVDSYMNYGLGDDYWSRIRRFLWFRSFNLYSHSKEDLDREAAKNEKIIQALQNRHSGESTDGLSESSNKGKTRKNSKTKNEIKSSEEIKHREHEIDEMNAKKQTLKAKKLKNEKLKKELEIIEENYKPISETTRK